MLESMIGVSVSCIFIALSIFVMSQTAEAIADAYNQLSELVYLLLGMGLFGCSLTGAIYFAVEAFK